MSLSAMLSKGMKPWVGIPVVIPQRINTAMEYLSFLFFVILASGCSRTSEPQAISEFQRKHPEEAKLFVRLYPVDLDLLREMLGHEALSVQDLADDFKREFANVPGVREFVEQKEREHQEASAGRFRAFNELEALASNGGLVCQYERNDGQESEVGLLVLNNGDIIKRDEWILKIIDPVEIKRIREKVDALERSK